jgi:protein-disulfide isomerase
MRTLGALACLTVAAVQASTGPVTVRDLDGRSWTPQSPGRGETSLVFFIGAECPVTRRYAPEIDRIAADYGKRGVRTWFVFAEPTLAPADARRHLKDFHAGSTVPAAIDAQLALTAAAGITVTPEAVVYTSAGRVYRGRIDNLYVAIGQSRREATTHDLRDALDAVLAGKPVAHAETTAVGCFVERTVK